MVGDFRCHHDLGEPLVLVERCQRIGALFQQILVEFAAIQNKLCLPYRDAVSKLFRIKVFVALETNRRHFVLFALVYPVRHIDAAVLAFDRRIDGDIEIAFTLIVGNKIALAFIDQILIDRTFLINRHEFPQRALPDVCALDTNRHDRPGVH